jgi:hypothetical protein
MQRSPRGKHDWIQTYTGRAFYPLDPDSNDVVIDDIGHALANMCRFTGHTREFYSVAQHSVMIALLLPRELALEGLLHDAAEAYLLDVARPVKHHPSFGFFRQCEKRVDDAIRAAFCLQKNEPDLVKQIDRRMLTTERRDLMSSCPQGHDWQASPDAYEFKIEPWQPARAKSTFMELARELRPAGTAGALPAWGTLSSGAT